MIGELLDQRYKITKALSRGAFAHTFLAEDTKRPQHPICVVKQLQPTQSQPEHLLKAKELFDREAQTLEVLGKHAQIPSLLAHLEIDGKFYLIEEYIPGQTLAEEFTEEQKKKEPEVTQLLAELLEILDFIHQQKIIHRDIKPSNIIRNQVDGSLVLIDFGAVMESKQETFLGTIIGTPGYIAPEQCQGLTGFYSDIYAVGIIGIQALTGINPNLVAKNDRGEIIWQDQVSISQEFGEILTKMVQINKSDRYQTAKEVLQDLNQIGKTANTIVGTRPSLKKILFPSLLCLLGLVTIPVFWSLNLRVNQSSNTNLPLTGKVFDNQLNDDDLCQDMLLAQDIYCQQYTLIGKKDQEVVIEMNSNDFDPLLILQQPNGNKLDQNSDRSVNNWNAQIKAKLPTSGKYTVITRTTSPGESGNYTIRAKINNQPDF